ncbi:LuxR C-terminal-related transcriptional regulator [Intrasporangium sp. DVR]|uniref:helix-turn-helix transcriptional regulator n=1 Tax=Intrasporangium sp. DVR TaxID=3127867 RepID=UPI00313A67E1
MPLSSETSTFEALSLEPLGLTVLEEQVYLRLVEHGSAATCDVAADLGGTPDEVARALDALASRGLAHREDFEGLRFRVISPDVALPELIRQRRRELNRLQDEAERISEAAARRWGGACDVVEPVVGASAVLDAFTQMQRAARDEVLMVDAPPYFAGGAQPNESEFVALAAGVSYRVIYHREAIVTDEARAAMRQYVDAGEQARVNAQVWPKLLVVDRAVALVPESADDPDPERRLLIRSSSILDVVVAHFEQLWERSTPVEALARTAGTAEPGVSERDREILGLMAAGLKDRTIARSLGITERTVGRRINDLMRRLDAETRFSAGVRAAQRGWISG